MNDKKNFCNIKLKEKGFDKLITNFHNNKYNKYYNIILIIIILLIISLYLLILYINPFNLVNINYSIIVLFFILFGVIIKYYEIMYKCNFNINFKKYTLYLIGLLILYIILKLIFRYLNKYIDNKIFNLIKDIFIYGLIGILIIYIIKKNYIKIFNFFNKLDIFRKLYNNIKNLYNNNSYSFNVIIFSLLLLLISFIPKIYNFINNKFNNATELLEKPIYLNNEYSINMNKFINLKKPNYYYAISFWYWINPQSLNTNESYNKYTNIFNYGNKPIVEINPNKNKFRIKYKKNDNNVELIYENKIILYQRWNNIFMNFNGSNLDIFFNGKLVASKPNIISKKTFESLILGENNGIHGGISKIIYYDKIIESNTIENIYNNFKNNKNLYR